MIDDDSEPPARGDSELLLYDYFKFLTSLTLLSLGGVLAIAQAAERANVEPRMLIAVLIVISAGGALSFMGASEIVKKRHTGASTRYIDVYRKVAPALLAVGVGMFLGTYVDMID